MNRRACLFLAMSTGLVGLAGCASTGLSTASDRTAVAWRKITQVDNRFAVFINEPGTPREGDLVTFRLAYIYAPGEVRFNDKVVGWQEYSAMTVNCATHELRPGPRVRYASDGSVMLSDDNQEFGEINPSTSADAAARVRCASETTADAVRIPDSPKWMDAARKHLAETPAAALATE